MPIFWRVLIINGYWILSKAFSASIEMIIWFLSFNLVIWYITFIDLHILKNACIPGINPTWLWCMSFLMYCWILFAQILLRIFASMWYWPVVFFFVCCLCLVWVSEVISTIWTSRSLIRSSVSDILLLIHFRVFLISVIVMFVFVYLFFNSSRSLLIDFCIFSILFSRFLIIFSIIILIFFM